MKSASTKPRAVQSGLCPAVERGGLPCVLQTAYVLVPGPRPAPPGETRRRLRSGGRQCLNRLHARHRQRVHEAGHHLTKQADELCAKVQEIDARAGRKWITACNARWAHEHIFDWASSRISTSTHTRRRSPNSKSSNGGGISQRTPSSARRRTSDGNVGLRQPPPGRLLAASTRGSPPLNAAILRVPRCLAGLHCGPA
jgi:hypothetical protein